MPTADSFSIPPCPPIQLKILFWLGDEDGYWSFVEVPKGICVFIWNLVKSPMILWLWLRDARSVSRCHMGLAQGI